MRFNCMRSDLSAAISNVSRAVSAKATIPALEGVLIKAYNGNLEISGYDLEIGIVTQVEASVAEEGEIVVSARLFNDIIRKLPYGRKRIAVIKPRRRNTHYYLIA